MISYNPSSNIENEKSTINSLSILCLDMGFILGNEKYLPQSPVILAPSFNSNTLHRLPYRYSQWKSTSIFSRSFTPCEHNLVMNLLIIIDKICRDNQITYFMIAGTLLGSLRHHDIIPWDDNVDVIIPYDEEERFSRAFEQLNQTLLQSYIGRRAIKHMSSYKVFYRDAPHAGGFNWHFPFLDIFFYERNKTHLWCLKIPDFKYSVDDIFPLVLRPLGQLWLPAPRNSHRLFEGNVFDLCITHFWNHRLEAPNEIMKTHCNQLNNIYPFVERTYETTFKEVVKLNDTVIQSIIFK